MSEPKLEPHPWIITASGGSVDLLAPCPGQIKLSDIAIALSRIPRFNGHTKDGTPVSVAQHSLLVEALIEEDEPGLHLLALLHDAHEAYLGDQTSPLKVAIAYLEQQVTGKHYAGTAFSDLCERFDNVIFPIFGLSIISPDWPEKVKNADYWALFLERDAFLSPCDRNWGLDAPDMLKEPSGAARGLLKGALSAPAAQMAFIRRVRDLLALRHGVRFDCV